MIVFSAIIKKYQLNGEKTGWYLIDIPAQTASQIKAGTKKSFRVKGRIDDHIIELVSLLPVGEGNYILPINATMRKALKKTVGAKVTLHLAADERELGINAELLECLQDEPAALDYFISLTPSHQRYFSKWIESAKTESTRTKRIARTVTALSRKQDFGSMLRNE